MKKLLTALAVLVALLGAAYGLGSLRWRPTFRAGPLRLETVARGAGPLLAGAAVAPLTPPHPVPVAGFARLKWMQEGQRDPVAVRALALREPGCTVVLVSAEILLVPGQLERAVERRVRDLKLDHLVVAATHTHAGPGGFWKDPLGERLATGPYDAAVFDHLVERTEAAIRGAVKALEPAYFSVARAQLPELARNRAGGSEVDGHLVSVRLTALAGHEVAQVVLYPAHATLLGLDNRLVSGDWPGALMRADAAPLLFFQGALGDQTTRLPPRTPGRPEAYAEALRAHVDDLDPSLADPWPALAVATATAVLPPADLGASPPALRRILQNLFYDWLPDRASLTAVRLGPLTLVAVPGEPVAEVGRRWREAAGEGAEVLALAGDYLGYVETSERMAEASGETVRTYYGPELADRLTGAVKLAAEAVRDPKPPPPEAPALVPVPAAKPPASPAPNPPAAAPASAAKAAAQKRTTGAPASSQDRKPRTPAVAAKTSEPPAAR
ncbi:neutral/alkaline non-lysosomal ceramidase N-terminal domain-containing protein [Anaeromyxobacter diazotrophicus]|uniref:neutral/alkaline non-lysosomal ceramidase N-terminal domain-containing protein n=1 Tax=Anaeromyxobacter diazotrophicus TaxID=2590199 RepID=UPI0015912223|nr:neutral/alkaline non-lysosomal ceramidase N-terminal domain-containing protein [Anaeromyxobacter diazotrophicus]